MKLKNHRFHFRTRTFPLVLFLLLGAAFGVLLPQLGFYWDDWEPIQVLSQYGVGNMWDYFHADRPLSAWTYVVFAPLVGVSPLAWQIFTLLLRFLAVLAMWWALHFLWPQQRRELTLAAVLFAIYPIFMQQNIAVSYHQHWLGFLLYFLSLGWMLKSVSSTQRKWVWIGLALAAQLLHLAIFEYFVGLELLRPVLLYLLAAREEEKIGRRAAVALKAWLPYLLVIALYAAWRLQVASSGTVTVNRPLLAFSLFTQPISTLLRLVQLALQDTIYFLTASWYKVFTPELLDELNSTFYLFAAIALASAGGLIFYLTHLQEGDAPASEDEQPDSLGWSREALVVGLLAMLLGTLPIWLTNRKAYGDGLFSDRFGLAAMFGASLFLSGLIFWLLRNWRKAAIAVALLAGLAVNLQLRTANDYRWSWTKQERVYWQLFWRVPAVQPHTTFLSEGYLFSYVIPVFSFNVLYQQGNDPDDVSYWFYFLSNKDKDVVEDGKIENTYRNLTFNGSKQDSLILFYEPPQESNCLWVLRPEDNLNPYLSENEKDSLSRINLNVIQSTPQEGVPPAQIFGAEPEHTWCYYYEKGELARQMQAWAQVVDLAEEAQSRGYTPDNSGSNSPQEWLAFIEGYIRQGELQKALELTQVNVKIDSKYQPALCSLWQNLALEISGPQMQTAAHQASDLLECN